MAICFLTSLLVPDGTGRYEQPLLRQSDGIFFQPKHSGRIIHGEGGDTVDFPVSQEANIQGGGSNHDGALRPSPDQLSLYRYSLLTETQC